MRTSVDFICAGASRCGTTTLYEILRGHPALFLPEEKELRFFDRDAEYNSGLSHYFEHFTKSPSGHLKGEVSPPYFHAGLRQGLAGEHIMSVDDSASRMRADLGSLPIILTLRNPIDRIRSQFLKNLREGRETVETLDEAVREELNGLRDPTLTANCWVYKNSYDIHLRHWIDLFGEDSVLILIFEDWIQDPVQMIRAVEGFLDVPPWTEPPIRAPHRNATASVIKTVSKATLWKKFRRLIRHDDDRNISEQRPQKNPAILALETREELLGKFSAGKDFVDTLTEGRASIAWK